MQKIGIFIQHVGNLMQKIGISVHKHSCANTFETCVALILISWYLQKQTTYSGVSLN